MFNSQEEAQMILESLHVAMVAYAQSQGFTASLETGIVAKNKATGEDENVATTEWCEIEPECDQDGNATGRYWMLSPMDEYGDVLQAIGFSFGAGVEMEYEEPEEKFDE